MIINRLFAWGVLAIRDFSDRRWWRWCCLALITASLILLSHPSRDVVVAQTLESETVEVDGIPLFELSSSKEFPAEDRARTVNQSLQTLVNTSTKAEVIVDFSKDLPVLKVEVGAKQPLYLLTVNSQDAELSSPEVTARTWQKKLQRAINRGQDERANPGRLVAIGALCLLLALIAHWGIGWFWRQKLFKLLPRATVDPTTGEQPQSLRFLLKAIFYCLRIVLWVGTIGFVCGLFPWTRNGIYLIINTLIQTFSTPFIPAGGKSYSVVDVALLLLLLAGLMNLTKTVQHLLRSRVLGATGLNRGAQEAVAFVANYVLLFIGAMVLFQLWGFDLSSLAVFASVLGVGIGLGLQGFAKNFISGMVLIFEQPIKVGDFVKVGDYQGTVERINVRSTEIRTLDQVSIIVPNSEFLESEVVNWDHGSSVSRLQIPVGVAYGTNPKKVREALMDAVAEYSSVRKDPPPRVFFTEFGDNSLNFLLLVWIDEPEKQFAIKSDLNFRIETILRHREIEIPFPQRDLHVRSGKLPLDLPEELVTSFTLLSQNLNVWLQQQSLKENASDTHAAANTKSAHPDDKKI
ncbi:mechanosensitive ion channel family protein [Acaryochloris marina]|uniref:Mechanosensitive ion channel, putative n=1 Tax=Acaryochloris marina (strain MBIC 11017) TaxID=329726 RepID=B0C549_ACAM1|nr:mechanosensitive ion channel domain-containing protein [Acaryochloris marina]ABW25161.1 mechanosensitive ion channel, putative [Acaryochloris marina MBIC11017]